MQEKHSETKIKELIKQYPEVGDALEKFQIDCIHCPKGDCRLKDVVEAENLSMDEEIELMGKISEVVE